MINQKHRWNLAMISLAMLLLFAGILAVIKSPTITGFAVLDTGGIWSQNSTVVLDANVTSLRITGSISGTGSATMRLAERLVYSSSQFTSSFENVCLDSCSISEPYSELTIVIDGEAQLAITEFNYTTEVLNETNSSSATETQVSSLELV